jgi:hypothetical protein
MKIQLFLSVISISIAIHQAAPIQTKQSDLKCMLKQDLLSCELASNATKIECQASSNIVSLGSTNFNVFGIGKPSQAEFDTTDASQMSFFMYPRTLDESVYLNHTMLLNGKFYQLQLFFSLEKTGFGIRVTDKACYEKLISLIKEINFFFIVQLEKDLNSHQENVELIGEALIETQNSIKRHNIAAQYVGYGFFGGYGWGGLYRSW